MKKSRTPVFVAVAVGVISGFGAWSLRGQELAMPAVPLTYDAVQQNDGESERRITFARRGDGSEVQITHTRNENGELDELRRIVDLQKNALIVVSPSQQTTTTFPYSPQGSDQVRRDQTSLCRFLETRGAERGEILGYPVLKEVIESPPLGTSARIERYMAPDLGCVAMETRHIQVETGGRERLLSAERIISVRLGEPNPSLFVVPGHYTEASPAEYARKAAAASGQVSTPTLVGERFEATYRDMRRSAGLSTE